MGAERRRQVRARVLRRARIVYRKGWASLDCVVLDISPTGAQIRVGALLGLPDRFELRIEGGPARDAVVRYRTTGVSGVEFVDGRAA